MTGADNRRVAKNTIYLYIRTFVSMIVSLYTSRKILEALGVEDFGILNVVGGVITLMAFINGSMSVATQRYLTYELGRGEGGMFNKVFNMSVRVHLIIALVVLICAETVGLWFINTHLNIPEGRMVAANWIYQASVLSAMLGIIQTPYNAAIVSHEHMHIYAYVGLGETFVRLLIVLGLLIYPYDRLAVWGFAFFALQLLVSLIYRWYCLHKFDNCNLRKHDWDKDLFKSILGFTGWNMFGTVAWTAKDQGASILLNIFGGPVFNAARGVSGQVTGAIRSLVGGFQTAVNPQLTKNYASGNNEATCTLLCRSSKISFFLMLIVSLPVLFEIDYILRLWLVDVPPMASLFTRLVIIEGLFDTLAGPMITSLMATGRIKWYQITVGSILLLNIPIAYLLLKMGCHIATPLVVSIVFMLVGNASRIVFCRNMIGLSLKMYVREVVFPIVGVCLLSAILPMVVFFNMEPGLFRLVVSIAVGVVSVTVMVFFVGFTSEERKFVYSAVRPRFVRLMRLCN